MSTFTVYTYYYILLPILYSTGVLFIVCYCFDCFNKWFGCFFCQYLVTSSHLNAKTIRIVRRSGHQRQTNRCNVTPVTSLCWSGLYQRLHQHLRIEFGAFFSSFWLDFDARWRRICTQKHLFVKNPWGLYRVQSATRGLAWRFSFGGE